MRVRDAFSITLALLVLHVCCGCGQNASPHVAPTVPVKGKVTYKGRPLTKGSIRFEPEDTGREAHGSIQPDGTFVLTTFKEGDGAIVGIHRVAVSATDSAGTVPVPLKFRNPSSSMVEVEVSEAKSEYTIDLK